MNVIHATAELEAGPRPVCLAIGLFDGVHLGHQQVIRQAVGDAAQYDGMSVVITFDRHPAAVLAPARVPPLIYPLAKKMSVIAALGPDTACVIHFDKAFSERTGEGFIRGLARDCRKLQSLSVGRAFAFGRGRSGDVTLLNALGKELNFAVHALAEVSLDGQPVSSTRVRAAVRAGRFAQAAQMLGRPYTLCGRIINGSGVGREMGVPTANLDLAGLLVPPAGVYEARAFVGGRSHVAAVNIGFRPTVAGAGPPGQGEAQQSRLDRVSLCHSVPAPSQGEAHHLGNAAAPPYPAGAAAIQVEAHLLDFAGDIYGEEMELAFLKKLREEQKFASLAGLREQIHRDIAQARELAGDP
jgi:riboflavin kinase/FMN adenylyltransferase